jgi:hypothetical protein
MAALPLHPAHLWGQPLLQPLPRDLHGLRLVRGRAAILCTAGMAVLSPASGVLLLLLLLLLRAWRRLSVQHRGQPGRKG